MKQVALPLNANAFKADVLVIGRFHGDSLGDGLPAELSQLVSDAVGACSDFKSKLRQLLHLPHLVGSTYGSIVLVGLGQPAALTQRTLRMAMVRALKTASAHNRKRIGVAVGSFHHAEAYGGSTGAALWRNFGRTVSVAACESDYRYDNYKKSRDSGKESASKPTQLAWLVPGRNPLKTFLEGLEQGEIIGAAQREAKDLMNAPPNDLYPETFVAAAQKAFKGVKGVRVEVMDEKKLAEMKVGGLLAVGKGSARPPRLMKISYQPTKGNPKRMKHYAFVGKGITFDSGGISLKPSASMDEMKYDMGGAAGMLGAALALAKMGSQVKLTTYLALAENMPAGNAQRPGDVIRMIDGQTVAVLNTDAEGRLVLADALVLASRDQPDAIFDMATLTGACLVALGAQACGALGNDEELLDRTKRVGERIGERAWPLPLYSEYSDQIKSNIADMKNIGGSKGGTITAAAFLQNFVDKNIPWVHLDIAGTAWVEGAKSEATGFGVWLLTELAEGAKS